MQEIRTINLQLIDDPVAPMRTAADDAAISELAASIKLHGLINPITVRPRGERFEVVAGHRRRLACKQAEVWDVPCVVRDLNDDEAADVMATENLERQDVDPVDEAIFLGRLVGEDAAKVPEVAKRLNRSEEWVWSRLEILEYPENFLPLIKAHTLPLGVFRELAKIESDFWRNQYLEMALKNGMSIVQARYCFDQWHLGLAPEPDAVLPASSDIAPKEPPKMKARCARCGQEAIEPNLTLVYIHERCPDEEAAREAALSSG